MTLYQRLIFHSGAAYEDIITMVIIKKLCNISTRPIYIATDLDSFHEELEERKSCQWIQYRVWIVKKKSANTAGRIRSSVFATSS